MALPSQPGETFLREVDENLRRDQLRDFAQSYGRWIAVAVVLLLAAVGGWLFWQDRQQKQAAEHSEEMSRIYADIGAGKTASVPQRLQTIAKEGDDVIAPTAQLAEAAIALNKNDRATAIARYRAVSADDGLPQPYRDLATVRLTALEFDQLKPADIVTRLEPLAKAGTPWFGSAGELTAMAYLKQGKKAEAGRLFATIAGDKTVPESIRTRAVQFAGSLGIDASAALPALTKQD